MTIPSSSDPLKQKSPIDNQPKIETKPEVEIKKGKIGSHDVSVKSDKKVPLPTKRETTETKSTDYNWKVTPRTLTDDQKGVQKKVIGLMKDKLGKMPSTSQPLARELEHGANALHLRSISKQIQNAADSSGTKYNLPALGKTSQNPVSKVGGPQFIPRSAVDDALPKEPLTFDKIDTMFQDQKKNIKFKIMLEGTANEKKEVVTPGINQINNEFQQSKNSNDQESLLNAAQKMKTSLEALKIEVNTGATKKGLDKNSGEALDKMIAELEVIINPISLDKVKNFYNKDEVLNSLRLELEASSQPESLPETYNKEGAPFLKNSESKQNPETILNAIEQVKAMPGSYVADSALMEATKDLSINFTPYVSSFEFATSNNNNPIALEVLKSATKAEKLTGKEFIFKTGAENTREILGGKLIASIGLSKHLVPKEEISLSGSEGIASSYLEGSTEYPLADWKAVMKSKKDLAVAKFHLDNASTAEEPKLRNNYQEALNKYNEAKSILTSKEEGGSKESIGAHALTDALLCAYDSHIKQYLVKDGEVHNIDFARFMAPFEAYTKGDNVYMTLRSAFIDHPNSSEPFSSDEINTITSWDMSRIEDDLRKDGIIGDEEFFNNAQKQLEKLQSDKNNFFKPTVFKEYMSKYNVTTKEEAKKRLENEMSDLKKECYSKVHPRAFESFKERSLALQSYVKDCQENGTPPTLKEAFPRMYPLAAPFMTVLERITENPSDTIGFEKKERSVELRSLNSIMSDAKKLGLATDKEMEEMKNNLEIYQKQAPTGASLKVTMDIN